MKTIIGSLLALGLLSSTASAWYCPPGQGYGYGHRSTYYSKPAVQHVEKKVVEKVAPAPEAPATEETPAEAAPAPEAEQTPQK